MTILLTGASGGFGRRAVDLLLDRLPAHELILMTRTPEKLADYAARGAEVRYGDFDDYESPKSAFAGADKLLLISASKVGSRIPQHTNAINAARAADARHVVYTSYIGKGPDNPSLPPPFDPELAVVLDSLKEVLTPGLTLEEIDGLRRGPAAPRSPMQIDFTMDGAFDIEDRRYRARGRPDIPLLICRPTKPAPAHPRPVIYYVHGGGMVLGDNRSA
jgi:hypothetical protein